MTKGIEPTAVESLRRRWDRFEKLCNARIMASDAAWASALSPAERIAMADDLLATVRAARIAAGDWHRVDDLAWHETLDDRMRQVQAFRRLDEAIRGSSPVADAV